MQTLNKMQRLSISLMLFSMFFGAGNLIFPAYIGYKAGSNGILAVLAFSITAVVLPILALFALARVGSFKNITNKVHPLFTTLFPISLYLISGPLLSVPRAGIMPFETSLKYLLSDLGPLPIVTACYTVIFFGITLWLCLYPEMLSNSVGKILTPLLLLFIFILFIGCCSSGIIKQGMPSSPYETIPSALSKGFIDGYFTLDALGALNLGILITFSIRNFKITEPSAIHKETRYIGLIAGLLLFIVYILLMFLGSWMAPELPFARNGAEIIAFMGPRIFGPSGPFILAILFLLACVTTCVGLISCAAEYFAENYSYLCYKKWCITFTVISCLIANVGLSTILLASGPILTVLYPMSIVLITLSLIPNISNITYQATVYTAGFIGLLSALHQANIYIPFLTSSLAMLPFNAYGFAWAGPTIVIAFLSWYFTYSKTENVS